MAKNRGVIGLEHCVWGKITGTSSSTGKYAYDTPVELGTAVKADLAVETNSLRVYGDNALQISDDEFKQGVLTTETNYSDLETEAKLYGHTYTAGTSGAPGEIVKNAGDVAPAGGVGIITEMLEQVDGVTKRLFRAVFFVSGTADLSKYAPSYQTRGESTQFGTNTVALTLKADDTGEWQDAKDFVISSTTTRAAALAAAKAYISGKFGISGGNGGSGG